MPGSCSRSHITSAAMYTMLCTLIFLSYTLLAIAYQPVRIVRHNSPIITKLYESLEEGDFPLKSDEEGQRVTSNLSAGTVVTLIGAQSLLSLVAVFFAQQLGTPNLGLGTGFHIDASDVARGCVSALPLVAFAGGLEVVEAVCPSDGPLFKIKSALADVRASTQKSILLLMGTEFRPFVGLLTAVGLGAAAGIGEEWLFRGVFQVHTIHTAIHYTPLYTLYILYSPSSLPASSKVIVPWVLPSPLSCSDCYTSQHPFTRL